MFSLAWANSLGGATWRLQKGFKFVLNVLMNLSQLSWLLLLLKCPHSYFVGFFPFPIGYLFLAAISPPSGFVICVAVRQQHCQEQRMLQGAHCPNLSHSMPVCVSCSCLGSPEHELPAEQGPAASQRAGLDGLWGLNSSLCL